MNIKKILVSTIASVTMLGTTIVPAFADAIGAINFESPTYNLGNINSQNGWSKTGPFDVVVDSVASFGNATSFGFNAQALRVSNSVTSGSFGDQTFSPGLTNPANETDPTHFEASFSIGSTQAVQQPGLFLSVSPDDGNGARMSYAGFDDQADGIHVIFYDVTDAGPLGTVASFNATDVATIDRTSAHTVKFVIDLFPGGANDVVKLYVDGNLVITGTTWEDYYRFDPEQSGNGNLVPSISKLLFRVGGTAATATVGNGFLVDNLAIVSGPQAPALIDPPTNKNQCKNDGWMIFNNPAFNNKKECEKYVKDHKKDGKAEGSLQLSGPKQKIKFEVSEKDNDHDDNKVEYWNYEYPGVLHYKAKAMCVNVDKTTKESRFMFQIPEGYPGLSGMYVVSYVKEVKHGADLYGHSATADEATAKAWCETGVGFSPSMYSVTKGEVEVE